MSRRRQYEPATPVVPPGNTRATIKDRIWHLAWLRIKNTGALIDTSSHRLNYDEADVVFTLKKLEKMFAPDGFKKNKDEIELLAKFKEPK